MYKKMKCFVKSFSEIEIHSDQFLSFCVPAKDREHERRCSGSYVVTCTESCSEHAQSFNFSKIRTVEKQLH